MAAPKSLSALEGEVAVSQVSCNAAICTNPKESLLKELTNRTQPSPPVALGPAIPTSHLLIRGVSWFSVSAAWFIPGCSEFPLHIS